MSAMENETHVYLVLKIDNNSQTTCMHDSETLVFLVKSDMLRYKIVSIRGRRSTVVYMD